MSGYVCTVAGGKGGVGKTTTAVNLGVAFEEAGYDVVVVDADLGMANLAEMLRVEYDQSIHDILAGESTVSEPLTDAQAGVTVVPGEQSLEAFADADPAKLRKVIKTLRNVFDVVFVDTGAGLSHETTVPLGLADGIVLVTTPDDVAVNDANKTAELADRVDGDILGGIITRATAETDVDDIAARLEFPLLGAVPEDIEATRDEPLVLNAPDSNPATAYRLLSRELEGLFFEDADAADLERVYDPEWFEPETGQTGDDEDVEEDDDDDDSGGRFGFAGLRS